MNISQLCRRELVSLPADATVCDAARIMRDEHVGAVAVTDPHAPGRVIGIITDRDLVVDLLAITCSVDSLSVGALCGAGLVTVPASASLDEAVRAMRSAAVRRLLVLGDDGLVCGLVSADDLFEALAGQLAGLVEALRGGAQQALYRADRPAQPQLSLYVPRNEP